MLLMYLAALVLIPVQIETDILSNSENYRSYPRVKRINKDNSKD